MGDGMQIRGSESVPPLPPSSGKGATSNLEKHLNKVISHLDSMSYGKDHINPKSNANYLNANNFGNPAVQNWKDELKTIVGDLKKSVESLKKEGKNIEHVEKLIVSLEGSDGKSGLIHEKDFTNFFNKISNAHSELVQSFTDTLGKSRGNASDVDPSWKNWLSQTDLPSPSHMRPQERSSHKADKHTETQTEPTPMIFVESILSDERLSKPFKEIEDNYENLKNAFSKYTSESAPITKEEVVKAGKQFTDALNSFEKPLKELHRSMKSDFQTPDSIKQGIEQTLKFIPNLSAKVTENLKNLDRDSTKKIGAEIEAAIKKFQDISKILS